MAKPSDEPEFVEGEGLEGEGEPEQQPLPQMEPLLLKPRNNIYTLLLLISILFILVSIYLVGWELRNFYDATFGILSPTQPVEMTSESSEPKPTPETPENPETPVAPESPGTPENPTSTGE
ncbi:MAG: hypothetical protein HY811_07725 [Planctomycetes bacterium]|nr:hypothetical protein [Planctomycetota bacterium]